jgi:tRNA(Ile)-lysidine synthase
LANIAKADHPSQAANALMQSCLALIPDEIERVYLAYSGGLDSSVLLHLLVSSQQPLPVIAWHVNHGLLETASQMEQFCVEQARHYGLEIRIDRLQLGDIESNIEAEARQQRYRLFASHCQHGDCVLTAHHADDQAETFLLNALRGSGSAGLRGIAARRKLGSGLLLRPLLEYTRQQLEDYASHHELAWFNDPSNRDNRFDRNYLRNEVIPLIAARWPHFQTSLTTSCRLQTETQQILDEVAQLDYRTLARNKQGSEPTLDLQGLLQLSSERGKNLLRHWISSAGLTAMPGARLRELMNQLDAKAGALPQIAMPDYSIRLYDGRLFLVRQAVSRDCHGVYEFGLQPVIKIDDCKLRLRRDELFASLGIEERQQRITLRFRGKGQLSADRHRLKRLFQKQRIPPWERQSTAQVYLDDKLVGLLR